MISCILHVKRPIQNFLCTTNVFSFFTIKPSTKPKPIKKVSAMKKKPEATRNPGLVLAYVVTDANNDTKEPTAQVATTNTGTGNGEKVLPVTKASVKHK